MEDYRLLLLRAMAKHATFCLLLNPSWKKFFRMRLNSQKSVILKITKILGDQFRTRFYSLSLPPFLWDCMILKNTQTFTITFILSFMGIILYDWKQNRTQPDFRTVFNQTRKTLFIRGRTRSFYTAFLGRQRI